MRFIQTHSMGSDCTAPYDIVDYQAKTAVEYINEMLQQFIDEYMTAIATEIVSKTSDEELAEMEHPEIHSYNTDNESNRTDDW